MSYPADACPGGTEMLVTALSAGVPPNTPAEECPVNSPSGGVAWPDPLRHQRQNKRIGTAGAGDSMASTAEGGQIGFRRAHLRTHDELAVIKHARDRVVDRTSQPPALGSDIDERDGRGRDAGMLVHRLVNSSCRLSGRKIGDQS